MAKRRGHGEGSIYPRKDGRWAASFLLPNGQRKYLYGKTQTEVRQKLRAAQLAVERGTFVETSTESVAAYLERWLSVKRLEVKDGTYSYYRRYLHLYVLPPVGKKPLQKVTETDIQTLYVSLLHERHLSPNTVRLVHTILHEAFEAAVERRMIPRNPAQDVTLPRESWPEMKYLSAEQAHHLLTVANADGEDRQLSRVILLALITGMRRGELMALRWNDIDFEKKTLTIHRSVAYINTDGTGYAYKEAEPKTRAARRTISLPDFAIDALREQQRDLEQRRKEAAGWNDRNLVFPNHRGAYLWPTRLVAQFKHLLVKAELPPMRFHDLRHSAATILLSMGVNPKVIQERLGHAHISITLGQYGHVSESMQREASDKLNTYFQPPARTPESDQAERPP